jgi:hypothetical protein
MAMKDTYIQAANVVAPRVRFNASSNIFTAAEQAAEAAGSPLHVPPIAGILKGPEDLLVGGFIRLFFLPGWAVFFQAKGIPHGP